MSIMLQIMTDEAVSSWRFDIHKCILKNCERLVELCVVKLQDDWFPLLDLLAMVLNPTNKFHLYNGSRPSEFNLKQYIIQQSEQKVQSDRSETGDGDIENIGKSYHGFRIADKTPSLNHVSYIRILILQIKLF